MESGEPFTVTADGTPALAVWVRPLDPDRPDTVIAGTNPWPLQDQEWKCTASPEGDGWVLDDCEAIIEL